MATGANHGGNSMCAPLRRVLVCRPGDAGWTDETRAGRWREIGYLEAPDAAAASKQHAALVARLEQAGCEVLTLPPSEALSLDAVYAHDPSLMTNAGAICLNMGKEARQPEPDRHATFYEENGIPVAGTMQAPGSAEAGDMVWLDPRTLLVGRGYRTNAAGIEQMGAFLEPLGAEVIEAPLPHGNGPAECLHLMSLMSVLSDDAILVDLRWLAVATLDLLRERGFRLIPIDESERQDLACNVLALGNRRLLAFEESPRTHDRMREAGFEVQTFPGAAIGRNGGGGPTCLTRPLLREGGGS